MVSVDASVEETFDEDFSFLMIQLPIPTTRRRVLTAVTMSGSAFSVLFLFNYSCTVQAEA
eukprot:scaffold1899_cov182-Alexandrium_tamarense.AAC.20